MYLDEGDPWSGILAAAMFAIRATVHTTLQATPSQLVFGRDAILNIKFDADWRLIRERKQSIIKQKNKRENARRIPHKYNETSAKYSGPHEIVKVNDNGTAPENGICSRHNKHSTVEAVQRISEHLSPCHCHAGECNIKYVQCIDCGTTCTEYRYCTLSN
jgi:hypothetical protein